MIQTFTMLVLQRLLMLTYSVSNLKKKNLLVERDTIKVEITEEIEGVEVEEEAEGAMVIEGVTIRGSRKWVMINSLSLLCDTAAAGVETN